MLLSFGLTLTIFKDLQVVSQYWRNLLGPHIRAQIKFENCEIELDKETLISGRSKLFKGHRVSK
jgi:hypothetical protein